MQCVWKTCLVFAQVFCSVDMLFCGFRLSLFHSRFSSGAQLIFYFPDRLHPNHRDTPMLRVFCLRSGAFLHDWHLNARVPLFGSSPSSLQRKMWSLPSTLCYDRNLDEIWGYSVGLGQLSRFINSAFFINSLFIYLTQCVHNCSLFR
jgi:hypothetical protein